MIIITGASGGLGSEIARLYQESGVRVVNISRRPSKYADTNLICSVSNYELLSGVIEQILAMDEPIQALIHTAGVWSEQHIADIDTQEIQHVMSVNSDGLMFLTSQLSERIRHDGADILNVISLAGTIGNKNFALYSASKWAQRGFTKSLQDEYADSITRVISFCPAGMNTDLFAKSGNTNLDTSKWMPVAEVAGLIKHILDLPKSIEVSEIILNKKVF